jgi:hypothetical protein
MHTHVYMVYIHCVRYMYMLHVYLVGSVASGGEVGEVVGEVAVEVGGVVEVGGGVVGGGVGGKSARSVVSRRGRRGRW